MNEFVQSNPEVRSKLAENFLIMKVNKSDDNENELFLSEYPKVPAYPHFFVLESDGTFLHSQNTEALEADGGYDQTAFLSFLDQWKAGTDR